MAPKTGGRGLIDLDLGALLSVPEVVSATEGQILGAYKRALMRTGSALRVKARNQFKAGINPRTINTLRTRLKMFSSRSSGLSLNQLRLWFGLNDMPVRYLKGKLSGRKQHQNRDPATGRFIAASRSQRKKYAEFTPQSALKSTRFENGYISRVRGGGRTIRVFSEEFKRSDEAAIEIVDVMEERINKEIRAIAASVFMDEFRKDLQRRVKHDIHVDRKTGRRIR